MNKESARKELFELDRARCLKCSACVGDCFFGALANDDEGFPRMANPSRCMRCQHCLAICPVGAVSFAGKRPEDSVNVKNLALPKAEEVENYLRTRRSVRRYLDKDVDRAVLERILKTLGNSPTGCNARSLKFTCFPTRSSMDAFRAGFLRAVESHRDGGKLLPRWLAAPAIQMREGKGDVFFRGAPGILVVSADETAPSVTTPQEDVVIACSKFEMLANAHGIGTCWCGFLRLVQREVPDLLEKALGIRRTSPFYAMLFGYPAVEYRRGVQRDDEAVIDWRDEPVPAGAHLIGKIADADRYLHLHRHFPAAFGFLKRKDLSVLPAGRYDIVPGECWAQVSEVDLVPVAERQVEAHRRCIDIQAPISGPETYGLFDMDEKTLSLPFDAENDVVLFKSPVREAELRPGDFAIFFPPHDGHASCCTSGSPRRIRKVVIKVVQS